MRRLILAWILVAVSIWGCSQYAANTQAPVTTFEYTCEALTDHYEWLNCADLVPPTIVTSRVVGPMYLGFYYPGEPYIFVRWDLPPARARNIIVHETVHYILDHLNILVTRCHSEFLAREITATYASFPIDPDWRQRYKCTTRTIK